MTGVLVGLLCIAVPFAVLAGAILLVVRAQQRARLERQQGMAWFAAQREWRFNPDASALVNRFRGDPFGRGSRRRAANSVEGTYEGLDFVAFDYSYVTSSGDSSTTHSCSVVAMHLGRFTDRPVPQLQVSPQTTLGRFFSNLFGTDLIIGDRAFDDAFHVRAEIPELARDLLHPAMIALLAGYQDRAWRLQDDSLLMFRSGTHTPEEIDRVLWSMKAILDHVPALVWARLGGER